MTEVSHQQFAVSLICRRQGRNTADVPGHCWVMLQGTLVPGDGSLEWARFAAMNQQIDCVKVLCASSAVAGLRFHDHYVYS